jgi:hypothetical protein
VALLAGRALRSSAGLHAATLGNPFFVTEMLRHGSHEVPRAVQDLVLARYAQLDAAAQAFVRLASVVPARIESWLIEQLPGRTAVESIEACLNCGLLVTTEPAAFCFRHELARVAIESSLSEPVARSLHAAVLEALVRASHVETSLARLVHHAARAGDHEAVLRYAPEAARQAQQRGAHREAAAHYGMALRHAEAAGGPEDAERMSAWLDAYARGCERTHQLDEYIAARLRLDALQRRSADVEGEARNLCQLAMAYALALRHADADAASRRAIELLETASRRRRARASLSGAGPSAHARPRHRGSDTLERPRAQRSSAARESKRSTTVRSCGQLPSNASGASRAASTLAARVRHGFELLDSRAEGLSRQQVDRLGPRRSRSLATSGDEARRGEPRQHQRVVLGLRHRSDLQVQVSGGRAGARTVDRNANRE